MSDSDGGCIGILVYLAIIGFIIYLIVIIAYYVAVISASIGGVYGGVVAITNYVKALRMNVKKERAYHV